MLIKQSLLLINPCWLGLIPGCSSYVTSWYARLPFPWPSLALRSDWQASRSQNSPPRSLCRWVVHWLISVKCDIPGWLRLLVNYWKWLGELFHQLLPSVLVELLTNPLFFSLLLRIYWVWFTRLGASSYNNLYFRKRKHCHPLHIFSVNNQNAIVFMTQDIIVWKRS